MQIKKASGVGSVELRLSCRTWNRRRHPYLDYLFRHAIAVIHNVRRTCFQYQPVMYEMFLVDCAPVAVSDNASKRSTQQRRVPPKMIKQLKYE